ncbi:uncharacterized protein LOC117177317 isoform X2 [Belonocnema kinseyi]|uniref:uncharacterized protein LOC117177317 isoform X2 n=1 Tax=Belonocnema kinseyi TaxID=2817044 RepID=UPI00143D6570|nr:uncharacterized protein LOC117177317 isoform X2 [Belonocnema kinseyi]
MYEILKHRQIEKNSPFPRRFWVRPIFAVAKRFQQGDSENLVAEMRQEEKDLQKYFTYFRILPEYFHILYAIVKPFIEKQNVIREPISAKTRLEITLRYLAAGDSQVSPSFAFLVAPNTISKIIRETCQKIYEALYDEYFFKPSEENWKKKIGEFETLWNFDHCMAAVDGKQVEIQVLGQAGSA